jgi:Lar family restriction alleviation protein
VLSEQQAPYNSIEAIKPCPFCDSNDTEYETSYLMKYPVPPAFWVCCNFCGASGPRANSSEVARDAWNQRA